MIEKQTAKRVGTSCWLAPNPQIRSVVSDRVAALQVSLLLAQGRLKQGKPSLKQRSS
ncbi:MAG: hypothetical protein ACFBSF_12375 [Leptolyngbyaceae cyanobacterium]